MRAKSEFWNIRNAAIVCITYVSVAAYLSLDILAPGNEAANTTDERVVLFVVVLLVAAPAMSIGVLIVYLRTAYSIRTRDVLDYLSPPKGSPGNPIIDNVIGRRGVWALNTFVKLAIAVWVMLLAWMVYVGMRKW